jgi:hypothetical protein
MKIISDIEKAEPEIKKTISKYGYLPQHYFN